jgi:type IV secretory pathway VirB6-like protein
MNSFPRSFPNSVAMHEFSLTVPLTSRWCKAGLMVLVGWLLLGTGAAHADITTGYQSIGTFETRIVERVTDMINDPGSQLRYATDRLFFTMALGLFIWKTVGWAFRGFDLADMFTTAAMIVGVGALMKAFPIIVPAMFQASLFIGNALLAGLAGVSTTSADGAALPIALMNLFGKYTLAPNCEGWILPGECLAKNLPGILAAVGTGLVLVALGIASLITDIWGFWGFAIAMAIGPVMLPFVLYPRLSFLFDGWVRFFIGFMVYTIIARINLALVAVALMTFQKATVGALLSGQVYAGTVPPVKNFAEVIGLLLFAGVGLFTLTATGSFARSMVMGAGGGGVQFSAIARNAVGTMAGAASGLINTGGAAMAAGKAASEEGASRAGVVGAAFKAAANSSVDATIKGNASFAKGYAVGRETAAGAISGAARGMKFGADPKTPTGGGVKASPIQRAQAAIGGALGGASAAARTTAAVSLGLKVTDSLAEKRQLDAATARANEVGFRAVQALDEPDSKLQGRSRDGVANAVYQLNETINTSKSVDDVRAATTTLTEALSLAKFENATARANEVGFNAAQALDDPDSKLQGGAREGVSNAVYQLNETINTATSVDQVRTATTAVTDALSFAKNEADEKRNLKNATARATVVGFRASAALDAPNSKLEGANREIVADAVRELNQTLNLSPTSEEVRNATWDVTNALSTVKGDMAEQRLLDTAFEKADAVGLKAAQALDGPDSIINPDDRKVVTAAVSRLNQSLSNYPSREEVEDATFDVNEAIYQARNRTD